MQSKILQLVKYAGTFLFLFISSAFICKFGGDSYEIRLGNKVLVKQFVTQPIALKSITLSKENLNDQLIVYYSHCGQTGKERIISLQDQNGNNVKQWKYTDAVNSNTGMNIPVKDIISMLDKRGNSLGLFYSSQQLPKGRFLTTLNSATNAIVAK